MYISHESPISFLDESRSYNDYDYALVHLFETHPEYYNFFKNSIKMGRQVLLDNSIPDVLEDGYATMEGFQSFTSKYPDLPGLKIGAVQGKTYDEIVDCYRYMSDFADYIAISFDFSYYLVTGRGKTKLERWCDGRRRLINQLKSDGIWNKNKPHHLLGCSLAKEFKHYTGDRSIRSADTSNPVVAGIKELRYNGDLGLNDKPSIMLADLIDHEVTDSQKEDILYNTEQFKKIIGYGY
jgi:hypothetical protein